MESWEFRLNEYGLNRAILYFRLMKQTVAYLDSNDGSSILALGETDRIRISGPDSMKEFEHFLLRTAGKYRFGVLSYDLKNELHGIRSFNPDSLEVPGLCFWTPECVVRMDHENIHFLYGEQTEEILETIQVFMEEETNTNFHRHDFHFEPGIEHDEYLSRVNKLQGHIQRGDIYEVNFCQEFLAKNVEILNFWDAYFKLNNLTRAPHSAFIYFDEFAILCGSPERFLKKDGQRLISQPIKGTASRSTDPVEDEELKLKLKNDPKERSENIMIVDLVRNDLSKIAAESSVHVDELCEIYSFETVHQMISTVSCELSRDISIPSILKATFPMGSMTGAPKIRAMELIEEYESFRRGFYSGSIGYISPNNDFDMNVVIRSLVYNKEKRVLSCGVGSAITIKSDPEKEYDECLTKIGRIISGMND